MARAPLNNSVPSSIGCNHPLLHSNNDSIEDAISHCFPAYLSHLHPPPDPIQDAHTLVEHLTPSPHLLHSSIMPAPSSLGAKVLPPVRRLLATVQAPRRGPSAEPRHHLHVATLAASRHGPEWPLG
jgi:hypothetical protein